MKRRSERETKNCQERVFRKVWSIYIENVDHMSLMKSRSDFLLTDLSQNFGIYLEVFAVNFLFIFIGTG